MKRIYKYVAEPPSVGFTRSMPRGAKILSVGIQGSVVVFWAEVDPDAGMEPRQFCVIGTGWDFENMAYHGTVQDGDYVWHLMEREGAGGVRGWPRRKSTGKNTRSAAASG
jgi:hypothetical protein